MRWEKGDGGGGGIKQPPSTPLFVLAYEHVGAKDHSLMP